MLSFTSTKSYMQDYSKVKVGDIVWWGDINSRGRGMTKGQVTKVGSKLITAHFIYEDGTLSRKPIVFRKDTGSTNDDYGHQYLIVDLEAYEANTRADKAWHEFRQQYSRPKGATYEDIKEAARILKININA